MIISILCTPTTEQPYVQFIDTEKLEELGNQNSDALLDKIKEAISSQWEEADVSHIENADELLEYSIISLPANVEKNIELTLP